MKVCKYQGCWGFFFFLQRFSFLMAAQAANWNDCSGGFNTMDAESERGACFDDVVTIALAMV